MAELQQTPATLSGQKRPLESLLNGDPSLWARVTGDEVGLRYSRQGGTDGSVGQ